MQHIVFFVVDIFRVFHINFGNDILFYVYLSCYSQTHFYYSTEKKTKTKNAGLKDFELKSSFEKAAFGPAREILVFITCAQNHTLNEHAQSSSASRGLMFKAALSVTFDILILEIKFLFSRIQ